MGGQQTYEKKLSITNHQENTNENCNQIIIYHFIHVRMVKIKNTRKTTVTEYVEKMETSCTVGRGMGDLDKVN